MKNWHRHKVIYIFFTCFCIFQIRAQQNAISSVGAYYQGKRILAGVTFGQPVADYFENADGYSLIGYQGLINDENPFFITDNYIEGLVHAGDSLLEFGIVKIINADSYAVADSFIVQQGYLLMENIPAGDYILMAEPKENYSIYYHTTYYVNKTSIEDAYVMPINTDIEDVDFHLELKEQFKSSQDNRLVMNSYPNPVNNELFIDFFMETGKELTVLITNSLGEIVFIKKEGYKKGKNTIHLNTDLYNHGFYFIRLTDYKELNAVQKFIK